MTIGAQGTRETFEAQLEEDTFHMLWLVHSNRRNSGRVQILLSAALQTGWRIRPCVTRRAGDARRTRVREREGAVSAWWRRAGAACAK